MLFISSLLCFTHSDAEGEFDFDTVNAEVDLVTSLSISMLMERLSKIFGNATLVLRWGVQSPILGASDISLLSQSKQLYQRENLAVNNLQTNGYLEVSI